MADGPTISGWVPGMITPVLQPMPMYFSTALGFQLLFEWWNIDVSAGSKLVSN